MSPLARTGGLGEAVAGLAGALAERGHDVTVAIPGYDDLPRGRKMRRPPWRQIRREPFGVVAFEDESFQRPGVYGPSPGTEYEDNWQRFARFAMAVADLASDHDLLHIHDGHAGPAALLSDVPTVLTIHNASYPLLGPLRSTTELLGLDPAAADLGGDVEWFGRANFLKAGIVGADQVTTVSPGHASELLTDAGSFGLGGLMRALSRPLVGILNGIDTSAWDPQTDSALPDPFNSEDLGGRRAARALLDERLGIASGFLLGNVGRMSAQKGLHLLGYDIDALVAEEVRFVFIGGGELDAMVDDWALRHPSAVVHRSYDEETARIVFAACDAYLIPSQYEPCGLGQMYAMRYGAPPIAHFTGGLQDTVIDIDEDREIGTGFVFRTFAHPSLTKTIRRAKRYHDDSPRTWRDLQRNGMSRDWSWSARSAEYETLYDEVTSAS